MTTARSARDLAATRDKLTAALRDEWAVYSDERGWISGHFVDPIVALLLPVVAEAIADELDAAESVLRALTEAVSRGDERGLPEAYRAAREYLTRARAADIREKAGRP